MHENPIPQELDSPHQELTWEYNLQSLEVETFVIFLCQ